MKSSDLKKLISARFNAKINRPIYIEGSPGLGKTQIAAQCAADLGVEFKVIHAPLLQPEDYSLPAISADKKSVEFIVSTDKFPLESSPCAEKGILLIDELAQADNAAQKILRNLIQEREIHGKKLKPGWAIIATGNRSVDRAGANRLLSHLSNVLTRVELEVNLDDWCNWALDNGIKPEIISFIRFKPDLLTNFNPQNEINATPRAWAQGVSAALGVIDSSLEFACFSGDVGQGPASEFLAFLQIYRTLPNPDLIILNPDKAEVPKELAVIYAICGALVNRTTKDNFGRVMQYIKRLPPEFSVLYVRDAMAKNKDLANSKDFIQWASNEGAKLLA